MPKFWEWLLRKDKSKVRGLSNILNLWLIFHVLVGGIAAYLFPASYIDIASKIIMPSASVLIGFSFAWAGRSASLFQDKSFSKFLIENAPPVQHYIYAFQLAILVCIVFILVNIIMISGGLGYTTGDNALDGKVNKFIMFSLGSIALRECWGVINFVNRLTLQYYVVRAVEIEKERQAAILP